MRLLNARVVLAVLAVSVAIFVAGFLTAALVGAQEPPKAAPTVEAPVLVSSEDSLLWERYQLLSRLAACQQDLLTMQNSKTLAEEYARLNQSFLGHYKVPVDHLERRGEQWIPRQTPPAK